MIYITLLHSVSLYARTGAIVYGMNANGDAWTVRDLLLEDARGGSIYTRALAAQLRAARAGEGISQAELAVLANVPGRTLSRIESGDVSPKAEQVAHIVWTMRLSLADFYAGVEARAMRTLEQG